MGCRRRDFIKGGIAAFAALPGARLLSAEDSGLGVAPASAFDYWCTWDTQSAISRVGTKGRREKLLFAGDQGSLLARDNISEELLFGAKGWARTMFPVARKNLYLLIDDGWDVPFGSDPAKSMRPFSALVPSADRFPGLGATGEERLANINARLKENGWLGTGLWVACQGFGEGNGIRLDDAKSREEWRRRMEISRKAGIRYWKIDWGCRDGDLEYRRMISEVRKEVYPGLVIENKPLINCRPLNGIRFSDAGGCEGPGRIFGEEDFSRSDWADTCIGRLCQFSDVVRIYDMLKPLDVATTLERIAYYGSAVDKSGSRAILNVEDSVTIGAVLGHAVGIMRSDEFLAEVDRAVAWRRIAPVVGGASGCATRFSAATLTDAYKYEKGEGWLASAWGREVYQTAPAVVSRGIALPEVKRLEEEAPFVAAMKHPNGALSVGTFPRVTGGRRWTPRAEIALDVGVGNGMPLAVFGEMSSLCLKGGLKGCRVRANDLAGGDTHDITASVVETDGRMVIPGEVLAQIGCETTPHDHRSAPGTLIRFIPPKSDK